MHYRHRIDDCFSGRPGGVTRAQLDAPLAQLAPAFEALSARRNPKASPLLALPFSDAGIDDIKILASDVRSRFNRVVVAGTGGSGLSGRTLTQLNPSSPVAFDYLENIDPDMMDALLASLDVEKTCFLIISKSGATVETLSQYFVLLRHVENKLGKQGVRERFIVITEAGDNLLRRCAAREGLRILDHPTDIGGRFSVLTVVGLLPAAIAGLDIDALRKGAQSVVAQMEKATRAEDFAPALGAALQAAFMQNHSITVMIPYSERLSGFSAWYRQIWAESLGKKGRGSTPIRAVGTTDQHSQLQLYLDGPKDKLFHMVMLNWQGRGAAIDAPPEPELDYLRGKTLGDVMEAEQKATFETLVRNHCPVRLFMLDSLDGEQVGALLMHFMLEVILTASLLDVNPFDQPAVEEGKKRAREYLLKGSQP